MVKKKRKVSVNAIDKYIKQIKYRTESKKPENTEVCQPKRVISRIRSKRLQDSIDSTISKGNGNETLGTKASVVKILRKRRVVSKHAVPASSKTVCRTVSSHLSQEKHNGNHQPENSMPALHQTKITPKDVGKCQKSKNRKKLSLNIVTEEKKKSAEKLKPSFQAGKNVGRKIKKPCSRTGSIIKANIVKRSSSIKVKNTITKSSLGSTSLENDENVCATATEQISENQTIQTENQEDISSTAESSRNNLVSNDPCLCETSNFGIDDFAEPNATARESLIPKKYRSCVEELKSLTAESITKFVMDNQQYYIDFRKPGHAQKVTTTGKKRQKNDFKDSFKCNPFDSSQQIAMFLALREIFHVPAGSFSNCRSFFTLLIPEICCQLFAQTFKIKTSVAPRLIRKFYSKPVCPV